MFARLLPDRLDAAYSGHRLGLWLFGLVVAVLCLQSTMSVVAAPSILQSADGIPLTRYAPDAAQTVVALFALLGFAKLLLPLLGVVVLARYRSAVPAMFVALLVARLGAQVVLRVHPIARVGSSPGVVVNRVLLALTLIGVVLSLTPPRAADRVRPAR